MGRRTYDLKQVDAALQKAGVDGNQRAKVRDQLAGVTEGTAAKDEQPITHGAPDQKKPVINF
jgi:hypothetical protein